MIPRVAHFVFGLRRQDEPFHFVHYLAVESCRRVLEPDAIHLHYRHEPWGPWWDRVLCHITPHRVQLAAEVLGADYTSGTVPSSYRYAHHADVIRLDALIEHGGVYADIDTVFVRPFPDELFEHPFVIGAEPPVRDELTGITRPSLCNAVLLAEPGSRFARAWRQRIGDELNGTWSNHSGFLAEALSRALPGDVQVEPEQRFFPFASSAQGISQLLEEHHEVPAGTLSVHLWAHLWWERSRRDFSRAHAGWCTPSALRRARTTFAELARPYLPAAGDHVDHVDPGTRQARGARGAPARAPAEPWSYLSLDEASGYGVAGDRCRAALESAAAPLDWTPLVPGPDWGLYYQPPPLLDPFHARTGAAGSGAGPRGSSRSQARGEERPVVVAHLVPEYLPVVRARCPEAFLVGRTVWETDRIPRHWVDCVEAADLLAVPSRFSAEAFAASPARTPVVVVPFAAAPPPRPASRLLEDVDPGTFVFYTIGEWSERKAVFHTVEAYLRAFRRDDPVLLVVKTSALDRRHDRPVAPGAVREGTSAWALARLLARHRDPPAVRLVTRELGEEDVSAMHRRGNCFVSLCRGEGWGFGAFDAATHGNPVVITGYGGQLDYLAASPYLVGYELVPVQDPAGLPSYEPSQRWAEPDIDHGAQLMREVLSRRGDAEEAAESLGFQIRWRYREAAIGAALRAAIETHRSGSSARRSPPAPGATAAPARPATLAGPTGGSPR